jgi:hypothetical protein
VRCGELAEAFLTAGGKADPYQPAVSLVGTALHEGRGLGPVDELDRAVMAYQEVARQVADGRRLAARVALDRQQQLMLRWRRSTGPARGMRAEASLMSSSSRLREGSARIAPSPSSAAEIVKARV